MWLLLIPPTTLLLMLLVTAARRRPARTREAMITIEGYRRMMAALAPPLTPVVRADSVAATAASPAVPFARAEDGGSAADPGDEAPVAHRDDAPAAPVRH
jgi:hypothetical protein